MKSLFYLGLSVFLVACFVDVKPQVILPIDTTATKKKPKIVPVPIDTSGSGGGGTGGSYRFEFNQPNLGNDTVLVHLVSNSRVCTPTHLTSENAVSLLEYSLYKVDSGNETLICYVKDDFGGHHPNYFNEQQMSIATQEMRDKINVLKATFVPVSGFGNYEDKGNNHLPQFHKTLNAGVYKWIVVNNGNTSMNVFAGYANSETENVTINEVLSANSTQTYYLNIVQNQGVPFKINCNNY